MLLHPPPRHVGVSLLLVLQHILGDGLTMPQLSTGLGLTTIGLISD